MNRLNKVSRQPRSSSTAVARPLTNKLKPKEIRLRKNSLEGVKAENAKKEKEEEEKSSQQVLGSIW